MLVFLLKDGAGPSASLIGGLDVWERYKQKGQNLNSAVRGKLIILTTTTTIV